MGDLPVWVEPDAAEQSELDATQGEVDAAEATHAAHAADVALDGGPHGLPALGSDGVGWMRVGGALVAVDLATQAELNAVETALDARLDALEALEAWHEVGAGGEPAFTNSWVNYGAPYVTAAFYKDPFGRVHIRGLVKLGAGNVFTLPGGYRPSAAQVFPTSSNGVGGELQVSAAGVVWAYPSGGPYITLDAHFRAA